MIGSTRLRVFSTIGLPPGAVVVRSGCSNSASR